MQPKKEDLPSLCAKEKIFSRYLPLPTKRSPPPGVDLSTLSQDDLERILNYHIIADSLPAAALMTERYQTNSGKFIDLTVDGGNVVIEPNVDAARVTTADISGSNGFIHIIDKVLTPPLRTLADCG